jgi:ankyrin repeat protein
MSAFESSAVDGAESSASIFELMEGNQLEACKEKLASMSVEEINNNEMNGMYLVHVALISNNPEMLKEVLKYNVGVDKKEMNMGSTPLMIAIESEDSLALEFAQILIDAHADVNIADNGNTTPLMKATGFGKTELVRLLIANKADVTALKCGSRGPSALHFALEYNFPEIVSMLLENGADVNVSDLYGRSPLMLGACFDAVGAVEELLKSKSVKINKQGDDGDEYGYGFTALHFAVNQGAVGVTKLLIAHGIDITIKESSRDVTAVEMIDQVDDDVVPAEVKEQLKALFIDC